MKALFWDIDGTLLTTDRAGVLAWQDAAAEILGYRVDLTPLRTSGLTDAEIASLILQRFAENNGLDDVSRLLRRYEGYLPSSLGKRSGRVLPGVRDFLDFTSPRGNVISLLLTGNTRTGAHVKLNYYGLASYFPRGGAFAEDGPDRASIARKALQLAQDLTAALTAKETYVIGDTPHDIRCGKAIGAKTVAVASGVFSATELAQHSPDFLIEAIPPPEDFCKILRLP